MLNRQKASHFLSKFFGPPVLLPLMLIFLFWQTQAFTVVGNWLILGFLLILCWLLPVVFFMFSLKLGWIDDIDATKRQQRYATYTLGGLGWLGGLGLTKLMTGTNFSHYYLALLVLILVLVIVTFVWKISIHAGTTVFFYLLINHFCHFQLWFLFPIPLLVMWARFEGKHHNLSQLTGGTLAAILIFVLFGL